MALNISSETQQKPQNHVDFPQFDIVTDPSGHHYFDPTAKEDIGRTQLNKIMKEWKILEKHLPDSIFVRVYEDRIDLMRAIIVGAAGTPYHDGLYLFDIFFPSNYPAKPPSVYYKSFGFRINPNLYEDGLVCLSLLNTWRGGKKEKWNPRESTILQILLSIQALVLNEKPFFNEPYHEGFLGQSKWESKSNLYNEDVFVLCCKTMLCHLRNPCKHFEVFIASHFEERRHAILSACMAYANGEVRIGHYNSTSSFSSSTSTTREGKFSLWSWICDCSNYVMSVLTSFGVSWEFKGSMHQLHRQLSMAFGKNEASLETLIEQFKAEKEKKEKITPTNDNGIRKKVYGKLKEVFGWLSESRI